MWLYLSGYNYNYRQANYSVETDVISVYIAT